MIGVYDVAKKGEINGKNLPSTEAGEPLEVHWEVEGTDKSGDFTSDQLTSNVSRIDIAEGALAELKNPAYDGKTLVLTVRGNFSSAKITATLKYVAVDPLVDDISSSGHEGEIVKGEAFAATGAKLSWQEGDSVTVSWFEAGETKSVTVTPRSTTPNRMEFDATDEFEPIPEGTELTFTFSLGGETAECVTRILDV